MGVGVVMGEAGSDTCGSRWGRVDCMWWWWWWEREEEEEEEEEEAEGVLAMRGEALEEEAAEDTVEEGRWLGSVWKCILDGCGCQGWEEEEVEAEGVGLDGRSVPLSDCECWCLGGGGMEEEEKERMASASSSTSTDGITVYSPSGGVGEEDAGDGVMGDDGAVLHTTVVPAPGCVLSLLLLHQLALHDGPPSLGSARPR